jgi:predicted MFS family arabinose efflux permease
VPFVVLTITGVVGMNYQVLLPVVSGTGAQAGVLHGALTAALGAGALTGSAWAAHRPRVHHAQLGYVAVALGVTNAVLAASGHTWLSAPALAGAGVCVSVLFATTTAQLQLSSAPERRVQTLSLIAISISAATVIGDPIVGTVVRYAGLRAAFAASSISAFIAAGYARRHAFQRGS